MASRDERPTPPKVIADAPSRVTADTSPKPEDSRVVNERSGAVNVTHDERPLGELFSELSQGLGKLFSEEVALAKAELNQKVSQIVKSMIPIAIGGVLAFGGYVALIATLIIGLAYLIPVIWAALIVTLVFLAIGGALIYKGMNDLKNTNPVPEKTIESLQEDKEWAKEQLK